MMTRIYDNVATGKPVVHFRNPAERDHTLCGQLARHFDLLGLPQPYKETSEPVTCPHCAKVYCAVKNEPWPSVEGAAMDIGMYEAVKEDGGVK